MKNAAAREIELYPPTVFKTLLDHEVNKSKRYGDSLTLVHLIIESDPQNPATQHRAEVLAIDALSVHLRDTDVPCKQGNEFLILMPLTSAPGARTACERLRKLLTTEQQMDDGSTFQLSVFMGMATVPIDHSVSGAELAENAAKAFQYARTNRLTSVAAFSEI
jgi:hypothetical protein